MLPRDPGIAGAFAPVSLDAWRAAVEQDLNGASFERRLVTHTYEGIYIRPLYTPTGAGEHGEMPGVPPYTRGTSALGTSPLGWDIRQERSEAGPAELNSAILDDLTHGVTSILLRLDAASRVGLDPDDPRAAGLAAADGALLPTLDDWRDAFKGVHLSMIGIWLEAGAAFAPAAAMLAALWEDSDIAPTQARGGFNADPLAVLARDGALPCTLERSLALAAELALWTDARYPSVTSLRVGTATYHQAGATATQDLAFSMATALEYLRALTAAGLPVDRAARQLTFSFAVGTQTFLAIAKLRAARFLWSRVVSAIGGSEASQRMAMHVRPSRRVFTSHDPWVNILRNSACVLAAGIAGAESIGSLPFDAALGPPSELSRRIARNTQIVLQEECHLHRVADPAGGSWYIESITDDLARSAWVILQAIESRGGMIACLRSGWIKEQVDTALAQRSRNIATRKDAIVGISEFPTLGEQAPPRSKLARLSTVQAACSRVAASRDCASARRALESMATAEQSERMSVAAVAARAGASLASLVDALDAHGSAPEGIAPLAVHPYAEAFERLRDATDRHLARCGRRPRAFLASMGPIVRHNARTAYARSFFEVGGFEIVSSDGYPDVDSAIAAFSTSHAAIAVICGADEDYVAIVPQLAPALHRAGARTVILAGNPGPAEARFRAAGIDRFIYVRCDVPATLTALLQEEGVLS